MLFPEHVFVSSPSYCCLDFPLMMTGSSRVYHSFPRNPSTGRGRVSCLMFPLTMEVMANLLFAGRASEAPIRYGGSVWGACPIFSLFLPMHPVCWEGKGKPYHCSPQWLRSWRSVGLDPLIQMGPSFGGASPRVLRLL